MKLYRHYKDKYYKFISTAKHSESLEDVVLYECLYENPSGKFWVRPSSMFFGSVEYEGNVVPRFAKIQLKIDSMTRVDAQHIETILPLAESVFAEEASARLQAFFQSHGSFYLSIASIDGHAVGFKLGGANDKACFFHFMEIVLAEFRGLGIGGALTQNQHEWCRKQGYGKVQSKISKQRNELLIHNLKSGFHIVGMQGPEIILEKKL